MSEQMTKEQMLVDLESAINRNSRENVSNTPDFLLAEYLMGALEAYERIHAANEKWYGKELRIGSSQDLPSWDDLMNQKRVNTPTERVLLNCIAVISSHPDHEQRMPWEIYDLMVKNGLEIFS